MIRFGQDTCGNLEMAVRREWLETNGLGGFASSTIVGLNSRRYHALLVAASKPPVERLVLLSKLEETLVIEGQRFDLSTNRYPGVIHPQGFHYQTEFRLDPFPVFTYKIKGVTLEKVVFMAQGENTTVVRYRLCTETSVLREKVELELRPLIAFRDYHSTTHENGALDPALDAAPGMVSVTPYIGLPSLHLAHNANHLESPGCWYRNFEYDVERERGLDFQEDLFNPCVLHFGLTFHSTATVIASTERRDAVKADELREAEIARRQAIRGRSSSEDDFIKTLTAAADQFIVARSEQKTAIAGYHWFGDWGRDTMIALPGLTLLTGRQDVARSILLSFAQNVDQGMLPNRFPDAGEIPEYNTVDATLWFFEAVRAYLAYSGDLEFIRRDLHDVLTDIISWHVGGTRFGIKVDPDGLLRSGAPGLQLTWMDAKIGDWVVTPRRGLPVEIQSLWFNALCIMEDLAQQLGDDARRAHYREMAATAKRSFNRLFWNEAQGYLYDVIDDGLLDASLRPNQIFAVSLPHSMLPPERAIRVVEVVEKYLLTPYGLRTLAPGDPAYRGSYTGDQVSRDGAYHQGTVWPWLLGPFITAYIKVLGHKAEARQQAEAWLSALKAHITDGGLGQISEIFDGDPPHAARGCIAQAWSVAEVLRAIVEDIRGIGAKSEPAN